MGWRLAFLAGAVAFCAAKESAEAGVFDWLLGGQSAASNPGKPSAFVLFSSQEFDVSSRHVSTGFVARPFQSFGGDRFIVTGAIGGGEWREIGRLALGSESDSRSLRAHVLAGAEFSVGGGALGLAVGPEMFREIAVDPAGVILRRERRWGVRGQIDWWRHPTPETLATANISAGSAKRDVWARAAFGWKIGNWGFVGPELSASGSPTSIKTRAGAHWTEFAYRGYHLRLSGGVAQENGGKVGAYLSFGSYRKF